MFSVFLAIMVFNLSQSSLHLDAALLAINLWLFTTALFYATNLVKLPTHSWDVVALRFLPVSDATTASWALDKSFRQALFSLLDVMVGLGTLGACEHLSLSGWIALAPLVPLTFGMTLALAAFGAARFPQAPYGVVTGNIFVLAVVAYIAIRAAGPSALRFIDHIAPTCNLLLPTGWPLLLFDLLLPDGKWATALLLIPIGMVFWSFRDSIAIIRARFAYLEPILAEAPDLVPEGETEVEAASAEVYPPMVQRRIGVTAIEESILSGQFLVRQECNFPWLECRLWIWLSEREKTLAEFAFPGGLALTKMWKIILWQFFLTLGLSFVIGMASPFLGHWIFGIGLFIVFSQAMAQVLGTGVAFGALLNGGVQIPIYAAYPISYLELSRMLIKYSIIQMPLMMLLTTASFTYAMPFFGLSRPEGMILGLKAGVLFFGARFPMLVFSFSAGSNDTSRMRLMSLVLLAFFAVSAGLFFGVGAIGVMNQTEWVSWPCCGLCVFIGYAVFRIYGRFYHTNCFDLMREPR